jgi:hypothetical protein
MTALQLKNSLSSLIYKVGDITSTATFLFKNFCLKTIYSAYYFQFDAMSLFFIHLCGKLFRKYFRS